MQTTIQPQKSNKISQETLLTPRFYTTDFDAMGQIDISSNINEFEALLEELKADYNRQHFIRDEEFEKGWQNLDSKTKNIFIEFLERSCTAEFSGFLLYKEISRRLKFSNPIIAECFLLISRDEARHAGFLNKSMGDFNLSLDLGFLTKSRKYTFFSPKFIFYATYLSVENWCQDENRHGDFFAALLKSQPEYLETFSAKIWCHFFLFSVFVTMYLNDCQRPDFYKIIGLDSRQYDMHVIRKTNESASRIFPVALNIDHPAFFHEMDICASKNRLLIEYDKKYNNQFIRFCNKMPVYLQLGLSLIKIYSISPIESKRTNNAIK